jgi:hypothetical protein
MLYDERWEYRPQKPERISLPKLAAAWLAALLLFAVIWGSLHRSQPSGHDDSFELVFSMG